MPRVSKRLQELLDVSPVALLPWGNRRSFVGASEVAAIMGVDPYSTDLQVYARKVGLAGEVDETPAMRRGKALERPVGDGYADEEGVKLLRFPDRTALVRIGGAHRAASPDGIVLPLARRKGLEVKVSGLYREWGPHGSQELPVRHVIQASELMHVLDFDHWDVRAFLGTPWGLEERTYRLKRNVELEATMVETVDRFWRDHVLKRVPPKARARDRKLLAKIFAQAKRTKLIETEDDAVRKLAILYDAKRTEKKKVDAEVDDLKAEIEQLCAGDTGFRGSWGTVRWGNVKGKDGPAWSDIVREIEFFILGLASKTRSPFPEKILKRLMRLRKDRWKVYKEPSRRLFVRLKKGQQELPQEEVASDG